MPRFIIGNLICLIISLTTLIWLVMSREPGTFWVNFFFSILVFINLTLIIGLLLFFIKTKIAILTNNPLKSDRRVLYRNGLKIASIIALFVSLLVFLKINTLFTLLNIVLAAAIAVTLTFYLYFKAGKE